MPEQFWSPETARGLPHLAFRSFLDALRQDDDITDVDQEVDPHTRLPAIVRKVYECQGKATLFKNVKGTHDGSIRVLAAPSGLRKPQANTYGRLARHIGLPPSASMKDLVSAMMAAKVKQPIEPMVVATGPVKEGKLRADQIDLMKLPAPFVDTADGDNYLQTYGIHIVQSPDGSWTNWSIARAMVYDKDHLVGLLILPHHIAQIREKWKIAGKDVPWALALGVPPVAMMAASMPLPEGKSHAAYIGGMTGGPLEVVKCETNGLYVPAHSEIVLEGSMSITETKCDGPFGEMHGYCFASGEHRQPLFKVDTMTHRNGAILPISMTGRAVDEMQTLAGTLEGAEIQQLCQEDDLPINNVFIPIEAQAVWAVAQVDTARLRRLKMHSSTLCRRLGNVVFRNRLGLTIHRMFVVGTDIDPYKFKDVIWAFSTRCRPGMDEYLFEDVPG
ncbi:MAG: hypothetical protein Q9167_001486 [Letrouitia subvulpina]